MYICPICIYVYMYTCIYVYMYICTYVYIYIYIYIYMYMHICIYAYMFICLYVYMFICVHVCMIRCLYVYMYVFAPHTHTHFYTCRSARKRSPKPTDCSIESFGTESIGGGLLIAIRSGADGSFKCRLQASAGRRGVQENFTCCYSFVAEVWTGQSASTYMDLKRLPTAPRLCKTEIMHAPWELTGGKRRTHAPAHSSSRRAVDRGQRPVESGLRTTPGVKIGGLPCRGCV